MPPTTRPAGVTTAYRPVWAEIDLDAVRANVRVLREHCAPAQLLAVVKADGYGHGAVPVARAALEAGATALGVALVEEGIELARPVSTRRSSCSPNRFRRRRRVWSVRAHAGGVHAGGHRRAGQGGRRSRLARAARACTSRSTPGCTGWVAAPTSAVELAEQVVDRHELELAGVCTHLAVADEPGNPYTAEQLRTFRRRCSSAFARARHSDRHRARVEHRGRVRLAGRALRHGARRDRDLRHRARRRSRRTRRVACRRCR